MAELDQHLQFFIQYKINTDPVWEKLTVIYSGHNVPGEGEHKILDYIRASRSQPDYNPNTSHCIYGLDADLIMLSLLSHEPRFTLLRETVTFGPRKVAKGKKSQEFQVFAPLLISGAFLPPESDYEYEFTFCFLSSVSPPFNSS